MTQIGPYTVVGKLGAGGMGEVYRARDARLGRDVAIKVLPSALANDADYIARFQREAQVLASLNHPNIAAIYGLEENAIVMELVEGAEPKGPLPLDEVVRIGKQIADALEAAHERGIVHRDLKPANIRITPDGTVKVLDFGLAKASEPAQAASASAANSPTLTIHATQAGMILGTAAYMSPEQAAGKPVDRRTDIWAFGGIMAELLTGRQLFAGETVSEILAAVILKEPDLSGVPESVRPVVERCLRRDVRRRWHAMGDVRIALEEPLVSPARVRERAVWPWLAALAVALAAVPAAWLLRPAPEQQMLEVEITAPSGYSLGQAQYGQVAISPDGKRIAFVATGTDRRRELFVRDLATGNVVAIAGADGAQALFWAPDSRWLGFFAAGNLMKVDVQGGRPQMVARSLPVYGSWSENGDILLSGESGALRRLVASTGASDQPVPLNTAAGERRQGTGIYVPGGNGIFYMVWTDTSSSRWFIGADGKPRQMADKSIRGPITPALDLKGNLWALGIEANGTRLTARRFDPSRGESVGRVFVVSEHNLASGPSFSVSRTGVLAFQAVRIPNSRLTWFSRDGRVVGTIGEPGRIRSPRVAPKGNAVVWTRNEGNNPDLWLSRDGAAPVRLTFSPLWDMNPMWTADGGQVLYSAETGERSTSVVRKIQIVGSAPGADGATGSFESRAVPVSATFDGRSFVFSRAEGGFRRQYLVPSGDLSKETRILEDEPLALNVTISPDNKWVLYSARLGNVSEVFVREFPSGQSKWQISTAGGSDPLWRADGKEIFFLGADGRMMAAAVDTTAGFRASTPVPLFQTRLADDLDRGFDVTPDGQRFLVAQPEEEINVPITVIFNWPKLLEGK